MFGLFCYTEVQKQQLHLAEKLKRKREERLKKLSEEHEGQKEDLLQENANKGTNTNKAVNVRCYTCLV